MRTSYPVPSFCDSYQYKIVDSTFIHAVHLAKSKGSNTYTLGVSMIKEQDTIIWYIVKDPITVYSRLTNPKLSPGFVFNNSVKGKQNTKQTVVDKKVAVKPLSSYLNTDKPIAKAQPQVVKSGCCGKCHSNENHIDLGTMSITQVQAILKQLAQALEYNKKDPVSTPCPVTTWVATPKTSFVAPKETKLPEPSKKEVQSFSYGPMLDVYNNCGKSSCIAYLALGYDKASKGLVIYYSLKSCMTDVYAIQTDDITLYRDWIEADSLGKFYNEYVRHDYPGKLLRSCSEVALSNFT